MTHPWLRLQCTTAYPCPPEKLGLNVIAELRIVYCPVGLSDHSGHNLRGLAPQLSAHKSGSHITFSDECFGPDVPASITDKRVKAVVPACDSLNMHCSIRWTKKEMAESLSELKRVFCKSINRRARIRRRGIASLSLTSPQKTRHRHSRRALS